MFLFVTLVYLWKSSRADGFEESRPQQVAHKTPRVIALERAQSIHIYFTFAEVFRVFFLRFVDYLHVLFIITMLYYLSLKL